MWRPLTIGSGGYPGNAVGFGWDYRQIIAVKSRRIRTDDEKSATRSWVTWSR